MKHLKKTLSILLPALVLAGCATPAGDGRTEERNLISDIDDLVERIAEESVLRLPESDSSNLAVYYFTADGRESPLSDYLINGLTTEMANRVPEGYAVVSRKGLDRIMEEYSFQLSDLVSEETQVDIGELLGADRIITGFITELDDRSNINVQIMDVHRGSVLGGFALDFRLEGRFASRRSSEVLTMERSYSETVGLATTTIIHESFDKTISLVSPGFFHEHWGERILDLGGETGVDPGGFAYLDFYGEVDSTDYSAGWDDSDMNFYMDLPLDSGPGENQGLYLKIRPEGFSRIYLLVRQDESGEPLIYGSPVSLTAGAWNELRVPFSNLILINGDRKLSRSENLVISIGIPYMENVDQHHFPGREFSGRLSVDEVGLYGLNEMDNSVSISSFEDEIDRVLGTAFFEGIRLYRDYSEDDSGVLRTNRGISAPRLDLSIGDDGPVGRYLQLEGELTVNESIEEFLDSDNELAVVLSMSFSRRPEEAGTFSFLYSSDLLSSGYLYSFDPVNKEAFESDFRGGKNWSRVSIDYSGRLYSEEETGMSADDPHQLRFIWPLPPERLKQAYRAGDPLAFTIRLDELMWEKK